MRKPQGQAVLVGPSTVGDTPVGPKPLQSESACDTFTCGHCQRVVHVMARSDPADSGGLCKCCMRLICPPCVEKGTCTPWEKAMEAAEARQDALRSYGV